MIRVCHRQGNRLYRFQAPIKNMIQDMAEKGRPAVHWKLYGLSTQCVGKMLDNNLPFITYS